jgi:dipeptidyl aminopeptidase/acylaminoacyl peptidase
MKIFSKFFLLLSIYIGLIFPQTVKRNFTIQDQINLQIPAEVTSSPNGEKILFTIRKANFETSRWNTQVYIMDSKTGSYYQFTKNGANCISPQFSPDNNYASFLSSREHLNKETNSLETESSQLWIANLNGGEADNWTSLKSDIEEYTWSKDSKLIAILSEYEDPAKELEQQANLKLKNDERVYPESKPNKALYILRAADQKIIKTFKLDPGAEMINFNSAGNQIAYQTNQTGEFDDEQKFDIYIIDTSGNKTQLTSYEGPETLPCFSPDDKLIAYKTQTVPDIEFAKTELCVMNPDGSSSINLTKDFPYSVNSFTWETPNTILATFDEKTEQQLYRINTKTKKMDRISKDGDIVSDVSVQQNGKLLCYRAENSSSLPEVVLNGKKLSNFSSQLNEFSYGEQKVIRYKSKDNKFEIEGVLFTPYGFDPAKKYPLITYIHGGPYGNVLNSFKQSPAIKALNQVGYIVFLPNPRGSSGYTDEFSQSLRYDLGGKDYEDIMTGVDYLISQGYVDETKMGVTGGSYGGYMTNRIISLNNRFKAAVSMFGMFSLFTDWSNSFQPSFEKMYFGYNYWEKPITHDNYFVNRSPAFYAQNIKTPTLILHGDKDVYTNVSNSREMYQALKALGVPVEFVIYPREGHGIKGEPNHYVNTIERMVAWFTKYIK